MKKIKHKTLRHTILTLIIMMLASATPIHAAGSIPVQATLSGITGSVEVQKGKADWTPAKDGAVLSPGDSVRTKEKASCIIKWSQGNLVKLQPLTTIKIDKNEFTPASGVEKASLSMTGGSVHAKAKRVSSAQSNFEIKTPTAIAGVRGTLFSVEAPDEKKTVVKCQQGKLNVESVSGGAVTLNSGEMTTVIFGNPPEEPKKMTVDDAAGFTAAGPLSEPVLEITKPMGSGDKVTTPNLTIEGVTSPGSLVEAYGATAISNAQGLFSLNVNLQPGKNQITVSATDSSSKTVQKTLEVQYQSAKAGGSTCAADQVLVCHKAGADAGKELCIANAAVSAHVKQGGCVGLCGDCLTSGTSTKDKPGKDSSSTKKKTCDGGQVAVCHKPGTSAEKDMCLPNSAVGTHMQQGGCVGACDDCLQSQQQNKDKCGDNNVLVCFNAGKPNQKEKCTPFSALESHINYGWCTGSCSACAGTGSAADTTPPKLEIIQPSSTFEPGSGTCTQVGSKIQCTVIGFTEPGAVITINGIKVFINPDGSFNQSVEFDANLSAITIVATDSAGNTTVVVIPRYIDETKVSFLMLSVNPASIVADNESTATVTVTGTNILGKPVTGATVSLSATSGGTLSPSSITLVNGTGSATFQAGAGSVLNTVTITATASNGVSATTALTLTPDFPPDITTH